MSGVVRPQALPNCDSSATQFIPQHSLKQDVRPLLRARCMATAASSSSNKRNECLIRYASHSTLAVKQYFVLKQSLDQSGW